jgi:hypothetical protein
VTRGEQDLKLRLSMIVGERTAQQVIDALKADKDTAYLISAGHVLHVTETDLVDPDDYWTWRVWTEPSPMDE